MLFNIFDSDEEKSCEYNQFLTKFYQGKNLFTNYLPGIGFSFFDKGKKMFSTSNYREFEEYLEKNYYYKEPFISTSKVELYKKYLDFFYNISLKTDSNNTYIFKDGLIIFHTKNEGTLNKFINYYIEKSDFLLKDLDAYICPKCRKFYETIEKKGNTIGCYCSCGHQNFDIL